MEALIRGDLKTNALLHLIDQLTDSLTDQHQHFQLDRWLLFQVVDQLRDFFDRLAMLREPFIDVLFLIFHIFV